MMMKALLSFTSKSNYFYHLEKHLAAFYKGHAPRSCLLRQCHTPLPMGTLWHHQYYRYYSTPVEKNTLSNQEKPPMSLRARLAITSVIALSIVAYMTYLQQEKNLRQSKDRLKQLKSAGLGGDWELINAHNGQLCSNADFKDQWLLVYFGFTHCPDICPDELAKILKVLDSIDDDKTLPKITPIFITIDPARDDCTQVKKYCEEFSPKLIGLTGTAEQINKAALAYRVYINVHKADENGEYLVDHSIIHYLMNPDGDFVDYYGASVPEEKVLASIVRHMTQ